MNIKTLIIGFVPPTETVGKKPREIRDNAYFKELLANFDLGEVYYAPYNNWAPIINEINPLFVIVFDDYYAEQVKDYKKDALIYVIYSAGQIFSRKAEIEKKKTKQLKTLTEISGLVRQAKNGDEKYISEMRSFASMSYSDMYKMLVRSIIGDNDDLRKKAWSLLTDNNVHKNFIWMRAQLLGEVWQNCDGKGKEEFLCMAMDQHIDNGTARKLDIFTGADGQQFHQYMFCNFHGCDLNYIRRIPFGVKKQDKYTYQSILDKYDTPTGIQIMLEAGQMRTKKEEYIKDRCIVFATMLKIWKEDPLKPMKELGVKPWPPYTENDPLIGRELDGFKDFLQKHDPASFENLFPKK